MAKIAKGQITLVDLNDGTSASMYLLANVAYVQIMNTQNNTCFPDYEAQGSDGLVITPHLYLGSNKVNHAATLPVANVTWTINGNEMSDDGFDSEYKAKIVNGNKLQIKKNLITDQYVIVCTLKYNDPNTGAELTQSNTLIASRIKSSDANVVTVLFPENGTSFIDQDNTEVKLKATVAYGSKICNNDAEYAIKYEWGYYNTTTNSFVGFSSATGLTAVGPESFDKKYARINPDSEDNGTDRFVSITSADADSACVIIDKDTITLKADAIDNRESIKCIATVYRKDGDTVKVERPIGSDADIFVVDDRTDPYSVEIGFTTMQLTTNLPFTTLTANVYQGDKLIDPNTQIGDNAPMFRYDWDAYTISNDADVTETVYWPQYEGAAEDSELITGTESYLSPGYWHCLDSKGQHFAQYTGSQSVKIWKSQITGAANVICTVAINLD